jgi:hypothetical protein
VQPLEEIQHHGYTIRVHLDPEPESPREWSNLGKMICFHRRYQLGDKHDYRVEDFDSWAELAERLHEDGAIIINGLWLYDHSGLSISAFEKWPYNDPWDAGQVGFICAFADDVRKEYGVKRISAKIKQKVAGVLLAEVKAYDEYLRGEVYGYVIPGIEDRNVVDSCWGFYGKDYMIEEAKSIIDSIVGKKELVAAQENVCGAGI